MLRAKQDLHERSGNNGQTTGSLGFRAARLCDDLVVFSMRSNPEPVDAAFDFSCKGPVMRAHAYRPDVADFLEMERGMPRIRFQNFVVLVGEGADIGR
mgnify:CR=1 FL=1